MEFALKRKGALRSLGLMPRHALKKSCSSGDELSKETAHDFTRAVRKELWWKLLIQLRLLLKKGKSLRRFLFTNRQKKK